MKELESISFSQLMSYKETPPSACWPSPSSECTGFCISCENKNLLPEHIRLDKLSHGCHSDVFYDILGEHLSSNKPIYEPILFLLESPGSSIFGDEVEYEGIKKFPPTSHYYFSPDTNKWPCSVSDVKVGYGDQFAYLVQKFNLRNAYFTNVVKCGKSNKSIEKWDPFRADRKLDRDIAINCYNEVLVKEIEALKPKVVFSFGANAFHLFEICKQFEIVNWQLNHPARPMNLQKNIRVNEDKIERLLKQQGIIK